ncbi:MAG TPA: type I DNA topoisomerase [Streptosporangiaceae bacterium]|nr:type I DNA topoisomerase [Streptosporangiaceae bacterium]
MVESPAKARTIAGYLGKEYVVESSIGHIRDMPGSAADVPDKLRKEPWARLGVNIDADFEPLYVVNADKRQQVSKLKQLLKDADELLLATDEDREGEAIAWHLIEELKPKVPAKRMVFHEITPEAIAAAVASPREMDNGLVEAYQTRRVLDRLYGYEVSPVLWKKVMPQLSAGRVQSVAVRLVVDRERERIAFRPARYWDLEADFATQQGQDPDQGVSSFTATLVALDGRRIAQGRDFAPTGELRSAAGAANAKAGAADGADHATAQVLHLDGAAAAALADRLGGAAFAVKSVERKPYRRSPYAPFRTTTLQQEASRKLGFSAKYTMQVAQRLYENGHITYMRTDSVTLSQTAITAARAQARELYGAEYLPDAPRVYASKVKSAQEAHEAIRPAGDSFRTPAQAGLSGDELRLYELVWKRTVASQMKDAVGESVSVRVAGLSSAGEEAEFGASGKIITFYGFLKAYVEDVEEADGTDRDDRERRLPPLAERDPLTVLALAAAEHATRAPARYTEASLIKELEDREIGRPSTYASIIGTILDRGYVFKKGTALVPSFVAFAVVTLLERHFTHLVDYEFTARMEAALDEIARGEAGRVPWLRRFYFGSEGENGHHEEGLKDLVSDLGEIDARDVSSFPLVGTDIVIRVGRYGPYLERDGQRVNVPEGTPPDELTAELASELLERPSGDKILGSDPGTGLTIVARAGRFGPYVTEVLGEDAPASAKPRTASLLKVMDLDSVTLDDALRLLTLPRAIGEIDGEPVTVQNGRYGPYVKKGTDSRSLESDEQLFTLTLDQARELFAQPKPRGRAAGSAAPPLRELGDDTTSGKPIVLREGRFGPYVTDGETNASLRKGDMAESITLQRAIELLAERRASGPAPKRRTAGAARSGAAKTGAAKTGAAKTGAAKTGAGAAKTGAAKSARSGTAKSGTAKSGAARSAGGAVRKSITPAGSARSKKSAPGSSKAGASGDQSADA